MVKIVKQHWSKGTKILGAVVFVFLMFFNIKLSTRSTASSDINLGGIKLTLVSPSTYADGYSCKVHTDCSNGGWVECTGSSACSKTASSVTCDGKTTLC
jgi:hypothetical protein